jgi:hypothetical protein
MQVAMLKNAMTALPMFGAGTQLKEESMNAAKS